MLWVLLTVIFVLFRLMPGDPTSFLVGSSFTEETRQQILANFGLNKPLHEQYLLFLKNLLLEGRFGQSFHYQQPVLDVIIPRMINTLLIMAPALTLVMVCAYFIGSYLGWHKGERVDKVGSYVIVSLRSLPHFVLGLFLLIIFAYWLGWFPVGGMGSIQESGTITLAERLTSPAFYQHLTLPFMTAFLFFLADPYLLMRGNIIDQKDTGYVNLLDLKGMPERIQRSHAARNAILPLLTYVTAQVAIAFGAQVLIEVVFSWPGIGRELILAVHRNDYPMAQAAFFIIGFLVITTNLLVDLAYGYVDPRISYN